MTEKGVRGLKANVVSITLAYMWPEPLRILLQAAPDGQRVYVDNDHNTLVFEVRLFDKGMNISLFKFV